MKDSTDDGPPWTAADTALLLRAWEEADAERALNAKSALASDVFRYFQQLSAGGDSGRTEESVQAWCSVLSTAHAVIQSYNAAAATVAQPAEPHATAAYVKSPWFALSEDERRQVFETSEVEVWTQSAVDLSEAQFTALSKLHAPVAASASDAPSKQRTRWSSTDAALLMRAWMEAASESAPRRATATAVTRRFGQLAAGGDCSGRNPHSVRKKHARLQNMYALIRDHDATASENRRWFALSEAKRRRYFAAWNKAVWLLFVDVTSEEFEIMAAIDRMSSSSIAYPPAPLVRPTDCAPSDSIALVLATPASETLKSAVPAREPWIATRARWSDSDTTLMLRVWAALRLEQHANPTAAAVALRFKQLYTGAGKPPSDAVISLKHLTTHNEYAVISKYSVSMAAAPDADVGKPSDKRNWFSLSTTQRRTQFELRNEKPAYPFVDLSEEHFAFISDTKATDGVDRSTTTRSYTRRQSQVQWGSEHTTLLLRAIKEVVAAMGPRAGENAVYWHFRSLSRASRSVEMLFHGGYYAMYFSYTAITKFVQQSAAKLNDREDRGCSLDEDKSRTQAVLDDWFRMPAVDRQQHLEAASAADNVPPLFITNLTREQYDAFTSLCSPVARRVLDPTAASRDRLTGAVAPERATQAAVAAMNPSRSLSPSLPSNLPTYIGREPVLPARTALTSSVHDTKASRMERSRAVDDAAEREFAHAREQSSDILGRIRRNEYGGRSPSAAKLSPGDAMAVCGSGRPTSLSVGGDSSTESEEEDSWDEIVPRSPARIENGRGLTDSDSCAAPRRSHQHVVSVDDSPRPLKKRMRARPGLVDTGKALEVLETQTAELRQLLDEAKRVSAQDRVERREILRLLESDRRERHAALQVMRKRLAEVERERELWRVERDALRRAWADL